MLLSIQRKPAVLPIIEATLLLAVIYVGLQDLLHLFAAGYLPPPFMFDPFDNLMDWFNTAYWAWNKGTYSDWGSVYPPLSFVFLRTFGIGRCYIADSLVARSCDWVGPTTLLSFFILNIWVAYRCFRFQGRWSAWVRGLSLTLGFPMLFALDRGNLVVPCFTAFALGHGRAIQSTRLRWLAVALSINFKPYLVGAVVGQVLRGRWRWIEGCAVATILVYVATYALFGAGSPGDLIRNTTEFAQAGGADLYGSVFAATSYTSILNFLEHGYPLMRFVGSEPIEIVKASFPFLIHLGQLFVFAAFVASAFRPDRVPSYRSAALGVAVALTSVEVGLYADTFLIFLVFLERGKRPLQIVALFAAYALCVPYDQLAVIVSHTLKTSFLSNRVVGYDVGLTFGMLVRPGMLLIVEYALAVDVVVQVFSAHIGNQNSVAPDNEPTFDFLPVSSR